MDTSKVKINLSYIKVRQIARAIERAAAKGKPSNLKRGDG